MADKNASLSGVVDGKVILHLSRSALEQLLLGMSTSYPEQIIQGIKVPAITVVLRADQVKTGLVQ
jgi:hypothetical protein